MTIIFALANLFSGIGGFFPNEQGIEAMKMLGYPMYLMIILGVAKILGSVAVVQTKWRTVKEWAYAGFTFDYLGASASFYFSGADVMSIMFPFVFLIVMVISYVLWKKRL